MVKINVLRSDGCVDIVEFDENDGYFAQDEYRCVKDNPLTEGWYRKYDNNRSGYKALPQYYGDYYPYGLF